MIIERETTTEASASAGVSHVIRLSKDAGRQLNDDKMRVQIDGIVASVNTAQRVGRGWKIELRTRGAERGWFDQKYNYSTASGSQGVYLYHVYITATCANSERRTIDAEFQNIVNSLDVKGNAQPGSPWRVTEVDGKPFVPRALAEGMTDEQRAQDVGYAPIVIPDTWESFFDHLYGLEPHIKRIRRSLDAAIVSNWRSRFHCALIGPPGCGKSDICQSIKAALGEEAVLEFDATSTTMAGAQKELAEREELPRVLLVEEIEKAPENSMSWLLSVLDLRGEIRKTTARGNILRDARMVAIATVNDLPTFKRVGFGALESRFSNKIFFQRPPRELLTRILEREVRRIDGNMEWINPALDFAEEIDTSDPREIIAITLCGRDDLLDGSYQADMRMTGSPESRLPDLGQLLTHNAA